MTSPYPNHDAVPGELYARLKAELERTQAVLADLIEEKHGAEARGVLQWIAHYREVNAVLEMEPARNEDGNFTCCDNYGWHSLDCPHMALWKAIGNPKYQQNLDRGFEEWCGQQERAERQAEYERTRCTARGSDSRCRLREGHAGVHDFPMGMAGLNAMFRELYPPARIENLAYADNPLIRAVQGERSDLVDAATYANRNLFGVDRSAEPQRLFGIEPSTFAQLRADLGPAPMQITNVDRENKIITVDQAPSIVLDKYGTPYTPINSEMTWADSANTNPIESMKRAKEALDKMNGRKP